MSHSSPVSGNALDKELVQRSVLETAFAYYRKYDSTELTTEDRKSTGVCRLNSGDSPEMTGDDRMTVCGARAPGSPPLMRPLPVRCL